MYAPIAAQRKNNASAMSAIVSFGVSGRGRGNICCGSDPVPVGGIDGIGGR